MTPGLAQAYLVCATPRSGSTLLCELLRDTGRAGRPLEHFEILRHSNLPRQPREYFTTIDAPGVLSLLPPLERGAPGGEPADAWWRRIAREGATDNGVWGAKIMWGHVPDFLARVRELPGCAGADLDGALRALLGDPELVFITRTDKVAQAVSLWRAVQTQSWRSEATTERVTPVYDFLAIDHLIAGIEADEAAWAGWFRQTGRRPLTLRYDDIEADPPGDAATVLRSLGLSDRDIPAPGLRRQRDELSSGWAQRYRSERERAA